MLSHDELLKNICFKHIYVLFLNLYPSCGFAPGFVNYKKGTLDSQPQVIKFTSCFPMVGGSLRVLRFFHH